MLKNAATLLALTMSLAPSPSDARDPRKSLERAIPQP
jgi:hypothetical protein